ncbi:unnamed protein product [Chrysoparadoxa australica]
MKIQRVPQVRRKDEGAAAAASAAKAQPIVASQSMTLQHSQELKGIVSDIQHVAMHHCDPSKAPGSPIGSMAQPQPPMSFGQEPSFNAPLVPSLDNMDLNDGSTADLPGSKALSLSGLSSVEDVSSWFTSSAAKVAKDSDVELLDVTGELGRDSFERLALLISEELLHPSASSYSRLQGTRNCSVSICGSPHRRRSAPVGIRKMGSSTAGSLGSVGSVGGLDLVRTTSDTSALSLGGGSLVELLRASFSKQAAALVGEGSMGQAEDEKGTPSPDAPGQAGKQERRVSPWSKVLQKISDGLSFATSGQGKQPSPDKSSGMPAYSDSRSKPRARPGAPPLDFTSMKRRKLDESIFTAEAPVEVVEPELLDVSAPGSNSIHVFLSDARQDPLFTADPYSGGSLGVQPPIPPASSAQAGAVPSVLPAEEKRWEISSVSYAPKRNSVYVVLENENAAQPPAPMNIYEQPGMHHHHQQQQQGLYGQPVRSSAAMMGGKQSLPMLGQPKQEQLPSQPEPPPAAAGVVAPSTLRLQSLMTMSMNTFNRSSGGGELEDMGMDDVKADVPSPSHSLS